MKHSYAEGYRHAVRDVRNKVKDVREEIVDPSGEWTNYYNADFVQEMLLDMALGAPDGPEETDENKRA